MSSQPHQHTWNKYDSILRFDILFDFTTFVGTVWCKIVCNEIFKYPISGSEKYQNEFPTPKYVGMDTLIIIIE